MNAIEVLESKHRKAADSFYLYSGKIESNMVSERFTEKQLASFAIKRDKHKSEIEEIQAAIGKLKS